MEYFLNEQQKTIRSAARRITEEMVVPARAELDEKEEFPWEIVKEIAMAGLFRIFIPKEYEGWSGGSLDLCLAIEELSRGCCGVSICYAAVALGTIPILKFGTDEQKLKYLPSIASGQRLAAFGLTETLAGSDAGAMKTTALLDGDSYVLNGTKQFISNGGDAEIYSVIALSNPNKGHRGASAFIVEKDTPGFTFGKKEMKLGIRASSTRELVFDNCRVPKENLLGKEGIGFIVTLKTLDESRPGVASQGIGVAQGALEEAVAYTREQTKIGRGMDSLQATQHMLVDMATEVEAARALVYAVARTIDSGATNFSEGAAMAKAFASDVAMRVTTNAVQILGNAGYRRDYQVEKMMRDAKIIQIYEGTNQILRNDMAPHLFKRKAKRE